jgi:large subunit ribosomal protein L29
MTARAVALDNLRALSADELASHLREQRGQLFQVRLQQTIGQVENHRQIRAIRKEIAQAMTVQVELRLAAERGEVIPARPAAPAATSRRARRAEAAAKEEEATATPAPPPPGPGAAAAAATGADASTEATATDDEAAPDVPIEELVEDVEIERLDAAETGEAAVSSDEETAEGDAEAAATDKDTR